LSQFLSGVPLLALLVLTGACAYGAALFGGDAVGLWKGYVGEALRSLVGTLLKRRSMQTG